MSTAAKVRGFFQKYPTRTIQRGEIFIRTDEDPPGIFYLKTGLVREYAISPDGEELVVNIFKSGSFFPMSWAINGTQNKYFFEAMSNTEAHLSPRVEAVRFIRNNPDVLFDLLSRVFRGTDGLLRRLVNLMRGDALSKLETELSIGVKRFAYLEGSSLVLRVSQKQLASQTGMSRETVSRQLRELKKIGVVSISRNSIVVKDPTFFEF